MGAQLKSLGEKTKHGTGTNIQMEKQTSIHLLIKEIKDMKGIDDWQRIKESYIENNSFMEKLYPRDDKKNLPSNTHDLVRKFFEKAQKPEERYENQFENKIIKTQSDIKKALDEFRNLPTKSSTDENRTNFTL